MVKDKKFYYITGLLVVLLGFWASCEGADESSSEPESNTEYNTTLIEAPDFVLLPELRRLSYSEVISCEVFYFIVSVLFGESSFKLP
jgi:hypothetical protein